MDSNRIMNRASLALLIVFLLGPHSSGDSGPPNVLCLIADDLRDELGCYGAPLVHSPRIDDLAARGVLFNHAYCQRAVCGPSRSSFLSGARPDTTRVYNNQDNFRDTLPGIASLPEHFKNHGYFTACFGKVLHDNHRDPASWSQPEFIPGQPIYAAPENEGKDPVINRYDPANKVNPLFEGADVPDTGYRDGLIAAATVAALGARPKSQPFFIMCGFHKPHTPFNAPKRYWDLYEPSDIPLAENQFVPRNAPAKYVWHPSRYVRSFGGIPDEGPFSSDLQREIKHAYWACISYVDALIGQVLDELDRQGVADNTIVALWSDHGYQLGEHDLWSKHTTFETSTKVPLIIVDPRKQVKGARTNAFAELVDLYPTLADLAGLPLPDHLEGSSLAVVLEDPDISVDDAAYSQFSRAGAQGLSVRLEGYRYTEWRDSKTGEVLARELYHHDKDPQENKNVAANPEYAVAMERAERKLLEMWAR